MVAPMQPQARPSGGVRVLATPEGCLFSVQSHACNTRVVCPQVQMQCKATEIMNGVWAPGCATPAAASAAVADRVKGVVDTPKARRA